MKEEEFYEIMSNPRNARQSQYDAAIQYNEEMDSLLTETIKNCMNIKLKVSREEGWYGWWFKKTFTTTQLQLNLQTSLKKEQYLDSIIYLSMLILRKELHT